MCDLEQPLPHALFPTLRDGGVRLCVLGSCCEKWSGKGLKAFFVAWVIDMVKGSGVNGVSVNWIRLSSGNDTYSLST